MIRPVKQQDISFMADIYNEYVVHGTATFEEVPLTEEEMSRRIIDISSRFPCLVCEIEERVVGYCYAHLWKGYGAYKHTLETTVYLSPDYIGNRFAVDERVGCRVSQAGIQGIDCLYNRGK